MESHVCSRPLKVFPVISVAHLDQAAEYAAHGSVVQTKFYPIAPHDIIKTVHVGLVHLLVVRAGHAGQRSVLVHIHQRLSAGNLYYVSVRRRRVTLLIHNRQLLRLHVHNRGKFVDQHVSLIPQLICQTAGQLNRVDLLVHRRQILRNRVDLIRPNLDLVVYVRLKIPEIPVHVIEIIRQRLRRAQKLRFILGADIFRDFLKRHTDLVKERLEPRLVVVLKILLNHIAVVEFRIILAELRLVSPVFLIVEKIPHTLDRQRLHARAGTAVCGKHPQRVSRLRLYLLPAVACRLHIADVVACGIQRGVCGTQSR